MTVKATATPAVYPAIAAVMAELASSGVSKTQRNQHDGYNFRGIDDVYNALAPVLAKHHLLMLPRVLNREVVERTSAKGMALFYVTVEMEFTLVSSEDGSAHVIKTYGEAMDRGDKATNKAMSAAFKYAAMQAFCIPTEGDNDADAETHEVAPRFITAEQAHELKHLAVQVGADVPKFLTYMKAETIEAIPANSFNAAKAALEAKRKKEAAAEPAAELAEAA